MSRSVARKRDERQPAGMAVLCDPGRLGSWRMMMMVRPRLRLFFSLALTAALLLAACGEGASRDGGQAVPGVTDDEVVFGTHMPMTGVAAVYGTSIVPAIRAYFDYVNQTQGGVYGRKLRLEVGDDAYDPAQSADVVRRLVEQDGVFAILNGFGTAQHGAVYRYLEESGVPDLFPATGARKLTEPPAATRFGYNPDYVVEGTILGRYIAEHFPRQRVGFLLQNDDFGLDGEEGLRAGIGDAAEVVARETFESTTSDLGAHVARLKSADPDVIAVYATPVSFANALVYARTVLDWDVPVVVAGAVADPVVFDLTKEASEQAGKDVVDGTVTTIYTVPLTESDHPGVRRHLQLMEDHGIQANNFTLYGQSVAELTVAVLQRAGRDLTRETLVEAAEGTRDFTCSVCEVPITFGESDRRGVEGLRLARAEGGRWVPFGDVISD
jgi:branched-chain amino acid transport system substrate-binding protein